MNGVELIAAERRRQIKSEGWTDEHDNDHHDNELALAAACYVLPDEDREYVEETVYPGFDELMETRSGGPQKFRTPALWPWYATDWKPSLDDRIRELVKAGALIAAEIDRLERAKGAPRVPVDPPRGKCACGHQHRRMLNDICPECDCLQWRNPDVA